MNVTKLIWVVLLTITFIVAILTTPICPEDITSYCMNDGYCIYLEECVNVRIFSMVYPKMQVKNVYIKCSIEHLKRLEEQRSLSPKIYRRDERLIFWNYVLALCHEMAPSGKIIQLQQKLPYDGSIKSTKSQTFTG